MLPPKNEARPVLEEDDDSLVREPLTPPSSELRDFQYMPLHVLQMRDSELLSKDPEVVLCNIMAWCISWHQTPAASLPNDILVLSRLLGYGKYVKRFQKVVIKGGLRGFILCKDGRLYHEIVAGKAKEAWEKKLSFRTRLESARIAKAAKKSTETTVFPEAGVFEGGELRVVAVPVIDAVTDEHPPPVNPHKGEGKGEVRVRESVREEERKKERKEESTSLRSVVVRRPSDDSAFERFWALYPRKEGKLAARKSWERAIRLADPEEIIDGLKRYAFQPEREYQIFPQGWLNQGRWMVERDTDPVTVGRRAPGRQSGADEMVRTFGLDLLTPVEAQFDHKGVDYDDTDE